MSDKKFPQKSWNGTHLGLGDIGLDPNELFPLPGTGGGFRNLIAVPGKATLLTGFGNVVTGGDGKLTVTGGTGLATVVAGNGNDTVRLDGGLNNHRAR